MFPYGAGGQQQRQGSIGTAVLAGLVVAIGCSLVWGLIAYLTKYQLSIMAILVGFAVGTVMIRVSGVRSAALGVASAVLAVFGCALGSLVAQILVLLRGGISLGLVLSNLNVVMRLYPSAVGGLGFLFWALAAFYGYRVAMGMPRRRGAGGRRMRQGGAAIPGQPYGAAAGQPLGAPNRGSQQQPTFGFDHQQPLGSDRQPTASDFGSPPAAGFGSPPAAGFGSPPVT